MPTSEQAHQRVRGGAKALILKRYLTHLPVQINRLQSQLVHTPPVFNVNGGMTTENKVTSSCAQHCLRNWPCSVIPILQHWNSVIFDHHHHLRQPFHDQFPQFRFMCLKRTADSANHNTKTRATRATSSSTTTSGNGSVELDNENPPPYTTTPTQPLRENYFVPLPLLLLLLVVVDLLLLIALGFVGCRWPLIGNWSIYRESESFQLL